MNTGTELRLNSAYSVLDNGITILNIIASQSGELEEIEITKAIHGVLEIFKKAEQELGAVLD